MTGPFVPVAMLNLIRAVLGIHHHRFNLSVKRSRTNEFTVLLRPDTAAPSAMLEKIVSAPDRRTLDQVTAGFYLDLTPPTDARPFFFNQLRFATLLNADVFSHFTHEGVFAGNLIATLTLAMLVLISVALVAATIVVPLRPTVREAGWPLAVGGTVYFALIGWAL
jgi:hypothetical protein